MDIPVIVSEFVDELLGLHGAYALTEIETLGGAGDAAAFLRLRVRLCDALIADGWTPTAEAAAQLERDRALLSEAHDDLVDGSPSLNTHLPTRHTGDGTRPDDAQDEVAQMRRALQSRAVIEQAKGIAMERYGLGPEVAWSWLVRTSQNRNEKLRLIAEELVASVKSTQRQTESPGSKDYLPT